METKTKIAALFAIYKAIKARRFFPQTHLAMMKLERIQKAFLFYGPEVNWTGRAEELAELFDQFQFARTYTNEFGHTGFKLSFNNA